MTDPWEEQERNEQQWAYEDALREENEKLREQIHWLKSGDVLHVLTDQEYIDQCERERLMQVSIDALDKENAKLRAERDYLLANSNPTAAELRRVRSAWKNDRDENAKLRELIRHMYECMCNVDADGNHECYSCEYENTDGRCEFERLMRELGIEVGE